MTGTPIAPALQIADLWLIVRRRRVVATTAAVAMAALILALPALVMPALYRAEATLTMDRGLKPVSFQSDPSAGTVPEQLVNTQRELLTSPAVLEAALAMGGLLGNPAYANAADPAAVLLKRLRSSVAKNSWVIQVSLDDEDPVRAESGLQSVLDAFLVQQATLSRNRGAEDLAFVAGQLAEAARKLQVSSQAERAFREQHAIASTDPDLNHITARIRSLAERQAVLDERVAASSALSKQVAAADGLADAQQRQAAYLRINAISELPVISMLQKGLIELLGQETELAARYLDRHPRLIEVRSRLAATRAQLDAAVVSARETITADNQRLVGQRAELVLAQESLQRELNAYRESLIELQRLSLETQAQQKVHDELLARQAQLTALAGYNDQRMVVNGRPRSSPVPRGLGWLPLALLAAFAGLTAAVAAAGIADSLDRSIHDQRQLHDLSGLRLLGSLPAMDRLQPVCITGPTEPEPLVAAMRSVATALRYAMAGAGDGRVVLVVGAESGDGTSTVAARLAAALSLAGSHTLLIDGHLHRPTQGSQFGIGQPDGLAQLLAGEPDLAPAATPVPNLDLMPAGQPPANPSELLNSHCLPEWIAQVRQHYDQAVIDAPALATGADALLLGDQVDAIVLVVRADATGREALAAALDRLAPLRTKLTGCVLIQSA